MGPEITELETKLAAYCGARFAVGCASGTDALVMALLAYGVGPGDAILTTPLHLHRHRRGDQPPSGHPGLRGRGPGYLQPGPGRPGKGPGPPGERRPQAPRAKGIIAVDLFGLPADYPAITSWPKSTVFS